MKKRLLFAMLSVLGLLFMTGGAAARPASAPLGTEFTYQGRLTDGGNPANADYDFEFSLWDAETLGAQVGSSIPLANVTVADGLFTVQLDFGAVFDGAPLWLQIGVAAGGTSGPYTALDPRQPLTPTPYAIYAAGAPWGGLTGVPAGFADGTDDGSSYQNVVVVAQSGGDFTTITAALNSITTNSGSNRYLVYVAPGVYTEQVTMKPYVDIQGSGELNTRITFAGSPGLETGTSLTGADNAELRFLTVENTGGNAYAIAIYNSSASPHLTHVTASASGGAGNWGVYNDLSSPTMTDVTASASGGSYSYGVRNTNSSPTMTNVTVSAWGGTNNLGVYNTAASPTMNNVTASGSGGTNSYGVYNDTFSSPIMTGGSASASLGSHNYGVYNTDSSPTMNSVTATGTGGSDGYGVFSSESVVWVNNSHISGSTNTIYHGTGLNTRVGASWLNGGPVSGTVICAGVYDENYNFFATTCP